VMERKSNHGFGTPPCTYNDAESFRSGGSTGEFERTSYMVHRCSGPADDVTQPMADGVSI
jgi:hypothetical protein